MWTGTGLEDVVTRGQRTNLNWREALLPFRVLKLLPVFSLWGWVGKAIAWQWCGRGGMPSPQPGSCVQSIGGTNGALSKVILVLSTPWNGECVWGGGASFFRDCSLAPLQYPSFHSRKETKCPEDFQSYSPTGKPFRHWLLICT